MVEGPTAPVAVELAIHAVRQSVQNERNLAAVAVPQAKAEVNFEGKGPSDPARGIIVDISV